MSRYKPVALRHKHHTPTSQTTTRTVAKLGLRIAALFCWFTAIALCVLAGRNLVENSHAGAGLVHWEPMAMVVGAIAAVLLGWRVWALKVWACVAACAGTAVLCVYFSWRPGENGLVEPLWAIATTLVCLLLFAAPLTAAIYVERKDLHSGI